MVTALSQVGSAMGSLAKGTIGGIGEATGLTGLASIGQGITGGWADAGRQIGQWYGQTQFSSPWATTARAVGAFQQNPTFGNLLMQLASGGTAPVRKKKEGTREGWD